jgi:hypothetical protein
MSTPGQTPVEGAHAEGGNLPLGDDDREGLGLEALVDQSAGIVEFPSADDFESASGQVTRHMLKFDEPDRLHALCVPRGSFQRRGRNGGFRFELTSVPITCATLSRIRHNHWPPDNNTDQPPSERRY